MEWKNIIERKVLVEGCEVIYIPAITHNNTKKYEIGKRLTMMAYINSSFKKCTSIHDRLAGERRYLKKANIPEWITNGRSYRIQKNLQRNLFQELYTDNVSVNDKENPYNTN